MDANLLPSFADLNFDPPKMSIGPEISRDVKKRVSSTQVVLNLRESLSQPVNTAGAEGSTPCVFGQVLQGLAGFYARSIWQRTVPRILRPDGVDGSLRFVG